MMSPIYRFFLQVGAAARMEVHPIYPASLAIEYALESEQRFFRAKLNGKLSFIKDEYQRIVSAPIETSYYIDVEKSDDGGLTWAQYYRGQFHITDCTVNVDDLKVSVTVQPLDRYTDILDGMERELDLLKLAPAVAPVTLSRRPILQLYVPGADVVTSVIAGTMFEQDAAAVSDIATLTNTYRFGLDSILKEMRVSAGGVGNPGAEGLYVGTIYKRSENVYSGRLTQQNGSYYIGVVQTAVPQLGYHTYIVQVNLYDAAGVSLYSYSTVGGAKFDDMDFVMKSDGGTQAPGSMWVEMKTYYVYARYVCSVMEMAGKATQPLPADDIVEYNLNYRRAIPVEMGVARLSYNYSDTPTEYGLADNGKYFAPPATISGQEFYPLAPTTWRYASLWVEYSEALRILEASGRYKYTLRDAYPLWSVIAAFLKAIAPGVTHAGTATYSRFLYSGRDPIAGTDYSLLVTPKTNILKGEYTEPARKAPATLKDFMNMLRDCFQLYWHIDEANRLRIEHVYYYMNGGTYGTGGQTVQYDLTALRAANNGKPWSFGQNEYTFNKIDMPERYEFAWMDDVSAAFVGGPIVLNSPYVQRDKTENISISQFTTDVDFMLLAPGSINQDGFALLAARASNALRDDPAAQPGGYVYTSGTNGYASPTIPLYEAIPEEIDHATIVFEATGGGRGTLILYKPGTRSAAPGVRSYSDENAGGEGDEGDGEDTGGSGNESGNTGDSNESGGGSGDDGDESDGNGDDGDESGSGGGDDGDEDAGGGSDAAGDTIIQQISFDADGTRRTEDIFLSKGATALGFLCTGTVQVRIYALTVEGRYEVPFVQKTVGGTEYDMQNGDLAMVNLQPRYWPYDLPVRRVLINDEPMNVRLISRDKKQTVSFPAGAAEPDPQRLIKTDLGIGYYQQISINLLSRQASATVVYDTFE